MLDFDSIFNKKKDTTETPKIYRIRNREIKQEKLLSQGAFGYIWKAIDVNSKQVFALKRVICSSKERLDHAKAEMETMEKLKQSPNIVKFYGGCVDKYNGNPVVITLMELCPNGTLFDQMVSRQDKGFTQKELLKIVQSIAVGIKSIHESGFAHRDIKIENVLLGQDNSYKLCDFGSCSSAQVDFAQVPRANYSDFEDEFETNTTPMYRPPQIVDPFKQYKVNKQVDVWMLGCVLYTIVYFVHPFIDASKAGISNAAFRITKGKCSDKINDLIRNMLTPNPAIRVNIDQVLAIVRNWSNFSQVPLNKEAKKLKEQFEKNEKQLSKYEKKTVGYQDDIPIQVLMKLQNQLKQKSQKPLTTFKTQHSAPFHKSNSIAVSSSNSNNNKNTSKESSQANDLFSGFQFKNNPKPTVDSWEKSDPFFHQPPIKKAHSLQFDFFTENIKTPNPQIKASNSVQAPNNDSNSNLTNETAFYEYFRSDSTAKKEAPSTTVPSQTPQFDFL